MSRITKLFLILFVINFAVFAVSEAVHLNDYLLYLFLLPVTITVSLILLIIEAVRISRKTYRAKDVLQRKSYRKRSLLIVTGVVIGLGVGFVILCFDSGYKIPGRDKHKNWPIFPGSSNPDISINAVPDLYIFNLEAINGTPYYLVNFTRDSIQFHDRNIGGQHLLGIIDNSGKFILEYKNNVTAFVNGKNIIIKEVSYETLKYPINCDVFNIATLSLSKAKINAIPMPLAYNDFSDLYYKNEHSQIDFKVKYGSDFYDNLQGIASFEESPAYAGDTSAERGYSLYKDNKGNLYEVEDYNNNFQLSVLNPQLMGYKLKPSDLNSKSISENIKPADKSIIIDNDMAGGDKGWLFSFYQTWRMYYTATVGNHSTSFKLDGGEKDKPYIKFYQLNRASRNHDTLVLVADGKVYRLFNVKTPNIINE
jgi:hypothetical protein